STIHVEIEKRVGTGSLDDVATAGWLRGPAGHSSPKMARLWRPAVPQDRPMDPLPHEACYRALASRDVRFDGRVFVGVRTTGIYCRPICPARTAKPENCTFFPSAAAAQAAGFRPCLRCRPEIS